jgi:hypothetical protein
MTLSPPHIRRPGHSGHHPRPAAARAPGRAVPAVLVYLGAPEDGPSPDLPGLARAVERLVHTLAPDVVTRVTIALPPAAEAFRPTRPAEIAEAPPAAPAAGEQPAPGRVDLGEGLELDLAGRILEVGGRRQPLTRREFELFAYLQRRRGVAVSRRELMAHVWGSGFESGDRTIDVHVRRLRVKLGRHNHRIITLRGYGYRFD